MLAREEPESRKSEEEKTENVQNKYITIFL